MKKYVKIHVMLFKHWELLLKIPYQTIPIYLGPRVIFFLHCFLSLLFSLLNQTRENNTFFPIFLSSFSILFIFITTKRSLRGKLINACHANTFFFFTKNQQLLKWSIMSMSINCVHYSQSITSIIVNFVMKKNCVG